MGGREGGREREREQRREGVREGRRGRGSLTSSELAINCQLAPIQCPGIHWAADTGTVALSPTSTSTSFYCLQRSYCTTVSWRCSLASCPVNHHLGVDEWTEGATGRSLIVFRFLPSLVCPSSLPLYWAYGQEEALATRSAL